MMGARVVIDGEYESPWRAARERIGMTFQSYTLWPHVSRWLGRAINRDQHG